MDQIKTLLENPIISLTIAAIGIIGTIIGVISAYFTIKGYKDQKNIGSAYEHILKKAQTEWKGQYTQSEIDKLTLQFKILQSQIQNEIPKHAQRVLLTNQLETLKENISELYSQYETVKKQLNILPETLQLDPSITSVIEGQFISSYKKVKTQNKIILSLLLVISFLMLFPYSTEYFYSLIHYSIKKSGAYLSVGLVLSYIAGLVLCFALVFSIKHRLFVYYVLKNKIKSFIVSVVFLLSWIILVYLMSFNLIPLSTVTQNLYSIISMLFLCFGVRILTLILSKQSVVYNTKTRNL